MKFFDQMYVGFQKERYNKADTPRLLGYAVPYDQTKASQTRVESVDRWKEKDLEGRIFDNVPTRGFKLVDVVSRRSTSNKFFRVLDPRGFELEISTDNLLELSLGSTIVKGEIIDDCVWATHGKIYLVSTSNPLYLAHTSNVKNGRTKIEEGKYYVNPGNLLSVFRFEGTFHHTYLDVKHVATEAKVEHQRSELYYRNDSVFRVSNYETHVNILMNKPGNTSYIYTEFLLNSEGNIERKVITILKSHLKDLVLYEKELSDEMKNDKLDPLQWVETRSYSAGVNISTPGNYNGFFKTRQEAKDFDYSAIVQTIRPSSSYHNSIDVSKFEELNSYRQHYYSHRKSIEYGGAVQNTIVKDSR